MKQVIYIDVLIAVNLFVNYFILLTTSRFLCLKWKTKNLIFGEVLGAIYSLYILIPEYHPLISLAVKLVMSLTIIWVTFSIKDAKTLIKTLLCFYSVSFAFSGIMFAIWCMWRPKGMAINNGIVYFNISPLLLIVFTLISYIIIEFINRMVGNKESKKTWCEVGIKLNNKYIEIRAKIDTGNSLREPFSNLPVIVVRESAVSKLFPKNVTLSIESITKNNIPNINIKLRMVPFTTVSGEGLLPAFKPDAIKIDTNTTKEAYIAICSDKILSSETTALLNPELLD